MAKDVLTHQAKDKIKTIHKLSALYNKQCGKLHNERLFELVDKHAQEIRELQAQGDPHYLVETGDLLILCYEILLEGKADIDEITQKCFGRYEKKLSGLLEVLNGSLKGERCES